MGLCTFIGKHIDVFFNVLFFNRNNVHLFALRFQYFLWIVLRISKEDSHFWTEPTKRDESFSLFLCSAVLWLLLSQTLCPVVKSDATDLEGCGTHSLPKSVIHYLPCLLHNAEPKWTPYSPHMPSRPPTAQGERGDNVVVVAVVRVVTVLDVVVVYVKVCCSVKLVNVCNSWSCKRRYCVRYCNATGLHKSTMHAMREGTSRDCVPFPFPSPLPLQIWAKGTRDTSC